MDHMGSRNYTRERQKGDPQPWVTEAGFRYSGRECHAVPAEKPQDGFSMHSGTLGGSAT